MRISKPSIPRFDLGVWSYITNSRIFQYKVLIIAATAGIVGITLATSGLVLLLLMLLNTMTPAIVPVAIAAFMLAVGITTVIADYIWLTI